MRRLNDLTAAQEITVRVEAPVAPLVKRILAILQDRIRQRCAANVFEAGTGAQIILAIDGGLPCEAFRIDQDGAAVRVTGGSPRGLLYGVGKFLRTSRYDGTFQPASWRGASTPQGTLRGMYFASQFYWNRDQSAWKTLEEYSGYEFGPGVAEDILAIIAVLETAAGNSYLKKSVDGEAARRAGSLAEAVTARLPAWARQNWRWEILLQRAVLDRERFAGGGLETPAAEAAMSRLIEIYHCQRETDDPYHHRVCPPSRRVVFKQGSEFSGSRFNGCGFSGEFFNREPLNREPLNHARVQTGEMLNHPEIYKEIGILSKSIRLVNRGLSGKKPD
jgi:hypothetical protein